MGSGMADVRYEWPLTGEFVGRRDELARMESWWSDPLRQPHTIYGRRRVGKSWLVRRFAHGRQAVVLVAEQLPPGAQMRRFAEQLAPVVGTTPVLDDAPTLLRVLYRAARERPLCVVLDEFPWLLGTSATEISRTLSAVQAVMEDERDASELKLILCGSHVATMESLFTERNPLHGRLDRLEVRPMPFGDVAPFFDPAANPVAVFERYAVAGGMPMYSSAPRSVGPPSSHLCGDPRPGCATVERRASRGGAGVAGTTDLLRPPGAAGERRQGSQRGRSEGTARGRPDE